MSSTPGDTTPSRGEADDRLHGRSSLSRRRQIVEVFEAHFGELIRTDPEAFRVKFRKMAATPFAFYRGSAVLFYTDIWAEPDPFLDERTSRVWIQGDLHAENFGTYMNSEGVVVFDVNDFDEAYVGPFTWDIKRLVASLALVGYQKALSDDEIRTMVEICVRAYTAQIAQFADAPGRNQGFALTRDNTRGALRDLLRATCARTRIGMLERSTAIERLERRFTRDDNARAVDDATRDAVLDAFGRYQATIPPSKHPERASRGVKDIVARRGVGIGSAGLPSFNLLVEGHTQALEHDVLLYMKQAQVATPSRFVPDPEIRAYFEHEGQRTAVSQRALQACADPWLGHTTLYGRGQLVAEVSPCTCDLDWDEINGLDDIHDVLVYLGTAAAKIHCVSDAESDQTLVPFCTEEAIHAALRGREDAFTRTMVEFAQDYGCRVRDDHRLFVDAFRNHELAGL